MANAYDIAEAQRAFAERLEVSMGDARRVMRLLQQHYSRDIAAASRADLLVTAEWAADRIRNRIGVQALGSTRWEELRATLTEGCPLCASTRYGMSIKINPQSGGQNQGTPTEMI
jgi:hypothetical protein